jgi:hypothetical protein
VTVGERLREKSSEYDLLAEWHAERAPLDASSAVAANSFLIVGIVLREVAELFEELAVIPCEETEEW